MAHERVNVVVTDGKESKEKNKCHLNDYGYSQSNKSDNKLLLVLLLPVIKPFFSV